MLDLNFLTQYAIPVIVGICLCIGYVIKTSFPKIDNKYIPCIMAILGVVLNFWLVGSMNIEILLGGMFSGLASTGLHQIFKNLIKSE